MARKGSHSRTTLRIQPLTLVKEKASSPRRIHATSMSRESGSPLLSQKITNATTQMAGPPQRRIRTVVGEASRERVASVAFIRKRLAARRLPQGHS
jgi:hypothetical protein